MGWFYQLNLTVCCSLPVWCCSSGLWSPVPDCGLSAQLCDAPRPRLAAAPLSSGAAHGFYYTAWEHSDAFPVPVSKGTFHERRERRESQLHKPGWAADLLPHALSWAHLRLFMSVSSSSLRCSRLDLLPLISSSRILSSLRSCSSWEVLSARRLCLSLSLWMVRSYSWNMFCSFTTLTESAGQT